MSFQPLLRRSKAPGAAALAAIGVALLPRTTLHAESPDSSQAKKPIYDDFESPPSNSSETPKSTPTFTAQKPKGPTPTEKLAVQIGKTRVFLHAHLAYAERGVNSMMDSFLHLENSFTSTIASLAPSPQSGEKLMPGSIYVLVAAMTGSIISRNRNFVLRALTPLAVGVGAGWVVIPVTMRNVSDLLWKYEERYPAIAEGHIRTRDSISKAWLMVRKNTQVAAHVVDEKVTEGRDAVEGWVRKGK